MFLLETIHTITTVIFSVVVVALSPSGAVSAFSPSCLPTTLALLTERRRTTRAFSGSCAASVVAGFNSDYVRRSYRAADAFVSSAASTDDNDAVSDDGFEAYSQTGSSQLAIKNDVLGDGDTIESGNVATVAYKARLMATGEEFDHSDGFNFKFGVGNVIPGWDQGLEVRRCCVCLLASFVKNVTRKGLRFDSRRLEFFTLFSPFWLTRFSPFCICIRRRTQPQPHPLVGC